MAAKKQKLQDKLDTLEKLSAEFTNQEELDLEEAVSKYETAAKLLKEIKDELASLELKVNEIREKYEE